MSRLSTEDAARRCASELETTQEVWEASRAKSMNKLAERLSRAGDTTRLSAFMLTLWGVEYDSQASTTVQNGILTVLSNFNQYKHGKIFTSGNVTETTWSKKFYSFGSAAYYSLPKDGSNETIRNDGGGILLSSTKFRIGMFGDHVTGEIIVPSYSVSADIFAKDPKITKPEATDFTAMRVVRDISAHLPHTVRTTPVTWSEDIPGAYHLTDNARAMSHLVLMQEAFSQTRGYNLR